MKEERKKFLKGLMKGSSEEANTSDIDSDDLEYIAKVVLEDEARSEMLGRIKLSQESYKKRRLIQYALFSIVGVLVVIATVIYFSNPRDKEVKEIDHKELFADLYRAPENMFSLKSTQEKRQGLLEEGFKFYDSKQYEQAADQFKQYLEQAEDNDPIIRYYLAASIIGDKPKEAIVLLDNLLEESVIGIVKHDLLWLKAIAILNDGRVSECKSFITGLEKKDRNERLEELLKKLK